MSFVAFITLMLFFTGCEEKVPDQKTGKVDVEFVLNNPGIANPGAAALKGGMLKSDSKDDAIPKCVDKEPATVHIVGTGPEGSFDMSLDLLLGFEDGKQTVLVKMLPGDYAITLFEVLAADGTTIYASPQEGSYYDNLFGFADNVEVDFTLEAFTKIKVDVDVLCWRDYAYKEFGYFWFKYHPYEVRTVCFFGDVCTKFYNAWSEEKGSPYAGIGVNGYDFPALFDVVVVNTDDPEHPSTASNYDELAVNEQRVGKPVCVEYLDDLEVDGETYIAQLFLKLPDGTSVLLDEIQFTDADFSETDGVSTWGGDDAIWEFAVGDCAMAAQADDIDGIYNIPWVPLPNEVYFTLVYPNADSYFALGDIVPDAEVGEFVTHDTLSAWCGNKDWHISINHRYKANVYPYFDIPAGTQYSSVTVDQWGALNYIANEVLTTNTYNINDVQQAIWYILGYNVSSNTIATTAQSNSDYIVPLGGYIIVLVDPYLDVTGVTVDDEGLKCTGEYQLALVRFDP